MKKYEYKIVYRFNLEYSKERGFPEYIGIEKSLEKLNEEGWELVSFCDNEFIFKKSI